MLDIDEPQLDNIMALLLLSQHAYQSGQGKKAYMSLCKCAELIVSSDSNMFQLLQ
jgi:hypothetical protein